MNDEIERLLKSQAGVVSRRQSLAALLKDQDIRRLLRRNDWSLIHDGVYVDHTGSPTWGESAVADERLFVLATAELQRSSARDGTASSLARRVAASSPLCSTADGGATPRFTLARRRHP